MWIYILTFGIVTLLSYLAEKKRKKMGLVCVGLIILILSVLGGLRSINIGTDVKVYGYNWFQYAVKSNSFSQYQKYITSSDLGYLLINYIVSRFTNNFNSFLFVLQVICNSLIVISIYRHKNNSSFTFGMLAYLCIYYCRSYNYLRQSIALAIVFFGFNYVERKKIVKYILCVILAMQFHFTASVAIIIYPIYRICLSEKKSKNITIGILLIGTIFVTINIVPMIRLLYNANVVNYRIYAYITKYAREYVDISIIETLFKFIILIVCCINYKKLKFNDKAGQFFLIMVIMDLILFQMRSVILYTDRFAYYFGYLIILFIGKVYENYNKNDNKKIISLMLTVLLLMFWVFKFVIENSGEVYPYSSVLFI